VKGNSATLCCVTYERHSVARAPSSGRRFPHRRNCEVGRSYRLPEIESRLRHAGALVIPLAWLLPLAELLCAAALIPIAFTWVGRRKRAGSCYEIARISVRSIRGRRPDGHWIWAITFPPIGWQRLIRNAVLSADRHMHSVVTTRISSWTRGVSGRDRAVAGPVFAVAGLAEFGFGNLSLFFVKTKAGSSSGSGRSKVINGELVDLTQLQTRRTLMLFWSLYCGFCPRMLDDLKRWEDNPQEDEPDLVVLRRVFNDNCSEDSVYASFCILNSAVIRRLWYREGGPASSIVGAQAVLSFGGSSSSGRPSTSLKRLVKGNLEASAQQLTQFSVLTNFFIFLSLSSIPMLRHALMKTSV
jgi:hypothetical protein